MKFSSMYCRISNSLIKYLSIYDETCLIELFQTNKMLKAFSHVNDVCCLGDVIPITEYRDIFSDFLQHEGILCVLIRIALTRLF